MVLPTGGDGNGGCDADWSCPAVGGDCNTMFDNDVDLSRRRLLQGAGALGAASVGGGAILLSSATPAVASRFNISGPAAVTSDDGSLNYVRLQANLYLEWDGFDSDVEYLRYIDRVTVRPNDQDRSRTVSDVTTAHLSDWSGDGDSDGWGGDGEYTSGPGKAGHAHADIDWNIIGNPDADDPADGGPRSIEEPADLLHLLENDEDGSTKDSLVVFEKEVQLLDGDQNRLESSVSSDDFVVSVTNQEATTSASGSGDPSADGDNETP